MVKTRSRWIFGWLLAAALAVGATTALAQTTGGEAPGGADAWQPKENFWWLFAAYAVIWVALLAYVGRIAGRQQELEREVDRLDRKDPKPTS